MKKYIIYSMTVAFALAAVFTACKKDKENNDIPVTGVTLNGTSVTLAPTGTVTLIATVQPDNATNKAVTWSSSNLSVAIVNNGLVTAIAEGTAVITVTTLEGNKTAACTLTVQDDTGESVVINGVRWATRNLDTGGQFVANPEDYGALFQWGRRADGHENRTSGTTTTLSDTDTPAHGDFILVSEPPHDWRNPQNDNLWGATKTANDPSPAGWRVPTIEELRSLTDTDNVTHEWTTENGVNGYLCTDKATGASLFLPAAGYRYYSNGPLNGAGSYGYYWSSTPNGSNAYTLYFFDGYFGVHYNLNRASGFSVRCVAEQK